MKEKIFTCSVCGANLTGDTVNHFEGQILCSDCLEEKTEICECCHERIWADNAIHEDNLILCGHCYEFEYVTCDDCGGLFRRDEVTYDNDYPYCDECYAKINTSAIHSYDYKPDPTFYGDGQLFYGIELEIDDGGEDSDNAEELLNIANHNGDLLYAKHDGSIDEGFELVSEPCTIDYHLNNFRWEAVMDTAISMGYRSHCTDTCGLHIHVSRSAFGKTYDEQEEVIARIVYFVEHHWNELVRFSRRTKGNLNRWAARYATISDSTKKTYNDAKKKNLGRYVAVNLTNDNTVEFRLFRGTLKYETFAATLQLVDEICRMAIDCTDYEFENMSWSDFVLKIKDKPELIAYLKSKRLYVNEITEEGAEL